MTVNEHVVSIYTYGFDYLWKRSRFKHFRPHLHLQLELCISDLNTDIFVQEYVHFSPV